MKKPRLSCILLSGLISCAFGLLGCAHKAVIDTTTPRQFIALSLPALKLAPDELVQHVELQVTCGRITALNRLPYDWAFDLGMEDADCTRLIAYAGHFGAGLDSTRALDGFVTILPGHPSRFELELTLTTAQPHPVETIEKRHTFALTNLVLKPLPGSTATIYLPEEWTTKFVPAPLNRTPNASGQVVAYKGDTLERLAQELQIPTARLRELNPGLPPGPLKVGQMITVNNLTSP